MEILQSRGFGFVEVFRFATNSENLIVDTTSTRVRSTDVRFYSGYKKQRVAKVQVLCDADGIVHSVSEGYSRSVHDKTIWNREFSKVPLDAAVFADKAYVGGNGEGAILFRPIARGVVVGSAAPH